MAQDSVAENSEELSDKARIAFAVREIERDPNLRFLFRQFFSFCHVIPLSSVYDVNPTQTAYNLGVQAAGMHMAQLLTSAAPLLMPALMLEEQNDATE